MIANIGFLLLFLAISATFFQIAFSIIGNFKIPKISNRLPELSLLKIQKNLTFFTSLCCSSAMLCLIYCFVISDFSLKVVFLNSHHLKPLIYKISGSWGNHEGSILLLATILTFYSSAFAIFSRIENRGKILVLTIQAFITFGLLAFIILTSSPFETIFPVPDVGEGLNPLLQDIGLAMHPPMLYTGYIGFSLIFSLAISALLQEKIDQDFARFMRPWLTFSWSFLTLGIGLGSWWAYRELGWGGYWFWDSVENVSLMPWLCATALLHSIMMLERTGNFKLWSCFLAILSFVFCLLGIFLVRSGILTSVHSFASDPDRGIFIILLFLIIGSFGFLTFFIKSFKIESNNSEFSLFSKTGLVLVNNFLLCLAFFIVVLGTLYPIILQIFFDQDLSVGAPYYSKLLAPVVMIVLSLMIFIPALKLQNFEKFDKKSLKKLSISLAVTIFLSAFLFLSAKNGQLQIIPFLAIFLALMVILFTFLHLKKPKDKSLKSIQEIISHYSLFLAHAGFSLIILAICVNSIFSKNLQSNMDFGSEISLNSYKIKFEKIDYGYGKNYLARIGVFEIENNGKTFSLRPESRYYPVSDQNTNEAAIKHNLFSDFYLVLGQKNQENNFAVRIYYRPFISFIWLGCFMMFISGMLFLAKINLPKTNSKFLNSEQ